MTQKLKRYYYTTAEFDYEDFVDPELGGPTETTCIAGIVFAANHREARRLAYREASKDELWEEDLFVTLRVKCVGDESMPNESGYMTAEEYELYCEAMGAFFQQVDLEMEEQELEMARRLG